MRGSWVVIVLVGCADSLEAPASPEPIRIENHTTYNNNFFAAAAPTSTTVTAMQVTPAETTPLPTSRPEPVAPTPRMSSEVGTFCACVASPPPLPDDRRNLASTGVASCDRYIDRLESLERCQMSMSWANTTTGQEAFTRLFDSNDMMRRTWRRAATTAVGRANMEDICPSSMKQIESSFASSCQQISK
jgi:hypothetical protein